MAEKWLLELTGKVLDDKYKLSRLIGQGSMGSVWEAQHIRINRKMAVKVLNPRYLSYPDTVERFLREGKAASSIGNPNIIEIFDVGKESDDTCFIVMELLKGESLQALLDKKKRFPYDYVLDVVLQVLSALHAAHQKGIIHRDVKPENIFLEIDSRMREGVKLLDFGVAKIHSASKLTATGNVLGTPFYISPEQAEGDEDIDERIDIWSVGVLMYEMLTGEVPFKGNNYNQLIKNIIALDPIPLQKLAPDVPDEIIAVIERAMNKDLDKRYRHASQMLTDLFNIFDQDKSLMRTTAIREIKTFSSIPPPSSARARKKEKSISQTPEPKATPKKRHKGMMLGGFVAVVLVAIVLIAVFKGGDDDMGTLPEVIPVQKTSDVQTPVEPERVVETGIVARDISLIFRGLPKSAKVEIDGNKVGEPITVKKSDEKLNVTITAPGYVRFKETIVPDRDQIIDVAMKKTRLKKKTKKKGKRWKSNPFG